MDGSLLRIYQLQVAEQCRYVLAADQDLHAATTTPEIWRAIQSMLVGAANISKLLWGKNKGIADGRAPLRDSLRVDNASPLRKRSLRNDFEHMDEEVARWSASGDGVFVAGNVGSSEDLFIGGDPSQRLQQYDPTTGIVTFRTDSTSLPDIVRAARQLLSSAEAEVNKHP